MTTTPTLVHAIEGILSLTPAVRKAFLAVDRALFVPQYYRHVGTQWLLQKSGADVYENKPLTTQVSHGFPSSSSSQPSVMAAMLEALGVEEGMNILEIGTGTGYNAALLALLVGDMGSVVSIDIDETLAREARTHLREAGISNVDVQTWDGYQGYSSHAPYDRILITAGFRHLALAWITQLASPGTLVGNLLGNLSTVLIRLEKASTKKVEGQLLPHDAFFMEMHDGHPPSPGVADWQAYNDALLQERFADPRLRVALKQQAFLFFLQGHYPDLQLHTRARGTPENFSICQFFLDLKTRDNAMLHHDGLVEAVGSVWEAIEQHYQLYEERGTPTLTDYQLSCRLHLHSVSLHAHLPQEQWCVRSGEDDRDECPSVKQ